MRGKSAKVKSCCSQAFIYRVLYVYTTTYCHCQPFSWDSPQTAVSGPGDTLAHRSGKRKSFSDPRPRQKRFSPMSVLTIPVVWRRKVRAVHAGEVDPISHWKQGVTGTSFSCQFWLDDAIDATIISDFCPGGLLLVHSPMGTWEGGSICSQ